MSWASAASGRPVFSRSPPGGRKRLYRRPSAERTRKRLGTGAPQGGLRRSEARRTADPAEHSARIDPHRRIADRQPDAVLHAFAQRARGRLSILDKRIVVHRRIVPEADESVLIKNIVATNYRRRGLMIAAPNTSRVRNALRSVLDRGEAVVTVVSNVADVPGIAYFGIDNYRAGRTAGLVMSRFARHPGRVMFLSGWNDWSGHLQRTAGCRDALTAASPHLVCDEFQFETRDERTAAASRSLKRCAARDLPACTTVAPARPES